jgi:2-dehydro-3-deoxyglucarate aldolase/4-hydroxy-2-oxoheptanedioate aldolase
MEDVNRAVSASKYAPLGHRGQHMLRPHTNFNPPANWREYCEEANKNTILGIQIETIPACELIDDIVGTDGVDMIYFGPGDLSAEMGYLNGLSDPAIMEVVTKIGTACKQKGKIAAAHGGSYIPELVSMGINVIGYAAELRLLLNGAEYYVREARKSFEQLKADQI